MVSHRINRKHRCPPPSSKIAYASILSLRLMKSTTQVTEFFQGAQQMVHASGEHDENPCVPDEWIGKSNAGGRVAMSHKRHSLGGWNIEKPDLRSRNFLDPFPEIHGPAKHDRPNLIFVMWRRIGK